MADRCDNGQSELVWMGSNNNHNDIDVFNILRSCHNTPRIRSRHNKPGSEACEKGSRTGTLHG